MWSMKVKLIAKTVICDNSLLEELKSNTSEELIMYCARVSNPKNQTSGNSQLLKYCVDNKHISIFEMSNFIFEIETSRAVSAQIIRHKSFCFQEFSQRYSKIQEFEIYEARRQDIKNRQNSVNNLSEDTKKWFNDVQLQIQAKSEYLYDQALNKGIAKESARFLLPQGAKTRLYMNGNLRSWIHYIEARTHESTQKEHRDIANSIKCDLIKEVPIVAEALGWL